MTEDSLKDNKDFKETFVNTAFVQIYGSEWLPDSYKSFEMLDENGEIITLAPLKQLWQLHEKKTRRIFASVSFPEGQVSPLESLLKRLPPEV